MSQSQTQIVADFKAYMAKNGGRYSEWYVGIAADPRARLFNDHRVKETGDRWIYSEASSATAAREIEKHFIEVLKTDGGPGGGDSSTRFVYAYKKAYHTDP